MLIDTTPEELQARFESGLRTMLDADTLGAFILVLANAMQHERLWSALNGPLEERFSALTRLHARGELSGAPDDVEVFAALAASGIGHFGPWRQRNAGPWQLAFNPMRALRPARASRDPFTSLKKAFDDNAFHFDKPFLKPEIMGETTFRGETVRVMYHKFPFAPYHLMLLIDAAAHRPQYMDQASHTLLWHLTDAIGGRMPAIGIAYNSLGAGASINHQHAHAFLQAEPLPIEAPRWRHNGGGDDYPVNVEKYTTADESGERIATLQGANQPFNLLYRPGGCYLVPRRPQGSVPAASWLSTPAWFEMAGGFNLDDAEAFERLSPGTIENELSRYRLDD